MKRYAVIGDPIKHSMSPIMHNDLFQHYGIQAKYEKIHVKRDLLEEGVKTLREDNFAGFNVTVPHKTAIIPFLDEIDPLAEAIGAVNTVVNQDGKWIGYNTDGAGYLRGLQHYLPNVHESKILIIGAGGAARGIYFTLAHHGVPVLDMINRTKEKATELKNSCPYEVNTAILSLKDAENKLGEYDLIIQTTSIGMSPNIEEVPLDTKLIQPNSLVSDIIYNPLQTRLLQEAKEKGANIQNGIDMFVYQGALAFEKWTGIFPDTNRMRNVVFTQLGG